jgi:hypothetical protein
MSSQKFRRNFRRTSRATTCGVPLAGAFKPSPGGALFRGESKPTRSRQSPSQWTRPTRCGACGPPDDSRHGVAGRDLQRQAMAPSRDAPTHPGEPDTPSHCRTGRRPDLPHGPPAARPALVARRLIQEAAAHDPPRTRRMVRQHTGNTIGWSASILVLDAAAGRPAPILARPAPTLARPAPTLARPAPILTRPAPILARSAVLNLTHRTSRFCLRTRGTLVQRTCSLQRALGNPSLPTPLTRSASLIKGRRGAVRCPNGSMGCYAAHDYWSMCGPDGSLLRG